ncbi:MAG: hypothetical protein HFG01_04550 [Oscillibacter sp.]|jgi:hypothetical protein|nr:hypothetical protein [Oscillibacter sp.]
MMNMKRCPVCDSTDVVRVPDNAHRYLANSICITRLATVKRVPVARYVCCACGYVENWVETPREREEIRKAFG